MIQNNNILKPEKDEYPQWFSEEIELVRHPELLSGLEQSTSSTLEFLKGIPESKLNYRYTEGKWCIQEIWQHVMDTERILAYRALRYSRKDETVLQGFDENIFATNSHACKRKWESQLEEYHALRTSTILLFKSFTPEMILLRGTAGKSTLTVRAVGFLILGHEIHHVRTIRERYL